MTKPISLFLFAHQDDEFGVYYQIECDLSAGNLVYCIFATDGSGTADPKARNGESLRVLRELGVSSDHILFLGRDLGIVDGDLYNHIQAFTAWFKFFLKQSQSLHACYVPAWEGGHPDHDILHALVVGMLSSSAVRVNIWQYSLYNSKNCIAPLFRVLSPLVENGLVQTKKIPILNRIRYLRFCLSYPSQWRSWIGLFPFVSWHYIVTGTQQLQRVERIRLRERPHEGPLYYETRGFCDWFKLKQVISAFFDSTDR